MTTIGSWRHSARQQWIQTSALACGPRAAELVHVAKLTTRFERAVHRRKALRRDTSRTRTGAHQNIPNNRNDKGVRKVRSGHTGGRRREDELGGREVRMTGHSSLWRIGGSRIYKSRDRNKCGAERQNTECGKTLIWSGRVHIGEIPGILARVARIQSMDGNKSTHSLSGRVRIGDPEIPARAAQILSAGKKTNPGRDAKTLSAGVNSLLIWSGRVAKGVFLGGGRRMEDRGRERGKSTSLYVQRY